MEIKDFSQAMALQKELSAKLTANIDKLRQEKAPSVTATVKEQQRLIAQAKAELAASEKQKELAVKRLDQQVAQRKAAVSRLEKGLKDLNKRLAEQEKATKAPAPKASPKKPLRKKISAKKKT